MKRSIWARPATLTLAISLLVMLSTSIFAAKAPPPPSPELLFEAKTGKKADRVHILGEDGKLVFIQSKANIAVHDGETGELIWSKVVPKYAGDGLDILWNGEYFITSIKKGMICYNLRNGNIVWETGTTFKMKTYTEYYSFQNSIVLRFDKKLLALHPRTGELLWEEDNLFNPSANLIEAGHQSVYAFDREFGGRLLLFENDAAYIYDADKGELLRSLLTDFSRKNPEPVHMLGANAIVLFFSNGTAAMSLEDGVVLWKIDDEVDPVQGYKTFETADGSSLAAFGFRRSFALIDLGSGRRLWETGEEFAVRPITTTLLDDSTLFVAGVRKSLKALPPVEKPGTVLLAGAFDLMTGAPKYDPQLLVFTPQSSVDVFGIVNEFAGMLGPYPFEEDYLFYVFADDAKSLADPDLKKSGGEGIVRINPLTGEVKFRTDFHIYDVWSKEMGRAGVDFGSVNRFMATGLTPEPVVERDMVYFSAGTSVIKLDVVSGDTLWTSPDYYLVQKFHVANGRVFGPIGFAQWSYSIEDEKKLKVAELVQQTRRGGYFILDAATGRELYAIQSRRNPMTLHLEHFDPETGFVLISDGSSLQALNLESGQIQWTRGMRKELVGDISGSDGITFIEDGVSEVRAKDDLGFHALPPKVFSSSHSMQHGLFPQEDNDVLIFAKRGLARVAPDGTTRYKTFWQYSSKGMQLTPVHLEKGLIYQSKTSLVLLDPTSGEILWQSGARAGKGVDIRFDSQMSRILFIGPKSVSMIRI